MKVERTAIPDVLLVELQVFEDARGSFFETYHAAKYAEIGIRDAFVQDNQSRSVRGVLRGLHAQLDRPQAKLVRVLQGAIFDVAADVRPGSPTFGRWVGMELSAENRRQCYIPPGFVHGFCVLSDVADVVYKCSDVYVPGDEIGVVWNDPTLAIAWPLRAPPLLSPKDAALPALEVLRPRLARWALPAR